MPGRLTVAKLCERERQFVRAGRQIDDAVPAVGVSGCAADALDERGTSRFDRHAGQDRAGPVGDDASEYGLRERRTRGTDCCCHDTHAEKVSHAMTDLRINDRTTRRPGKALGTATCGRSSAAANGHECWSRKNAREERGRLFLRCASGVVTKPRYVGATLRLPSSCGNTQQAVVAGSFQGRDLISGTWTLKGWRRVVAPVRRPMTKAASATEPAAKIVSPMTRIQRRFSMTPVCRNSGLRAYQ